MKVLIVGECFSDNLGDGVICETVKHALLNRIPGCSISFLDLSAKEDYKTYQVLDETNKKNKWLHRQFTNKKSVFYRSDIACAYRKNMKLNRLRIQEIARVMSKKYDLILFAGGALFMDYFAFPIYCITAKAAICNTPVVFHACGMGSCGDVTIRLFRKTFCRKNVFSISLRDSYQRFIELFGNKGVTETYDTALYCPNFFSSAPLKIADFGVGLINQPEYEDAQKLLIELFRQSNLDWRVFLNGSESDRKFAARLLTEMGMDSTEMAFRFADIPADPQGLVTTVTSFRYIVSFRMHSQIIASAYGIPAIGLVWDAKVNEFFDKIGLPKNVCAPEEFTLDKLTLLNVESGLLIAEAARQGAVSVENLYEQLTCALKRRCLS